MSAIDCAVCGDPLTDAVSRYVGRCLPCRRAARDARHTVHALRERVPSAPPPPGPPCAAAPTPEPRPQAAGGDPVGASYFFNTHLVLDTSRGRVVLRTHTQARGALLLAAGLLVAALACLFLRPLDEGLLEAVLFLALLPIGAGVVFLVIRDAVTLDPVERRVSFRRGGRLVAAVPFGDVHEVHCTPHLAGQASRCLVDLVTDRGTVGLADLASETTARAVARPVAAALAVPLRDDIGGDIVVPPAESARPPVTREPVSGAPCPDAVISVHEGNAVTLRPGYHWWRWSARKQIATSAAGALVGAGMIVLATVARFFSPDAWGDLGLQVALPCALGVWLIWRLVNAAWREDHLHLGRGLYRRCSRVFGLPVWRRVVPLRDVTDVAVVEGREGRYLELGAGTTRDAIKRLAPPDQAEALRLYLIQCIQRARGRAPHNAD